MSSNAAAALGFVALFGLILLRVPVGHGDGACRRGRLCRDRWPRASAQDGRADLDADGHRLHIRRHPDVPADGRLCLSFRHEPRIVSRGEQFHRPLARRAWPGDDRRLRGLRRDQRFVGRDRRHLRHRRLSRDAAIRLSAILRRRSDRRRRDAWRDLSALDGACRLWPHHPAGHRQAVHRRHSSGLACCLDVHDDDRRHRHRAAGLSARWPAQRLERAAPIVARRLGCACAVRVRDRRALRRPVHADRGRRSGRLRRVPDLGRAGKAQASRRARGAAAGDAHRCRGVHRSDRRAACSAISSPSPRRRRN